MDRPRQTAADFDPQVLRLFDQYVHGRIARRDFLDRAGRFAAAAGTTSAGLLAALAPDFAAAERVPADDPRLDAQLLNFPSPAGHGQGKAYVVRPKAVAGVLPVVLVAHENRGLSPHIRDIARRLALENLIAVAPDALAPLGGYPGDEDRARELWGQLDAAKVREDFVAAANWARGLPGAGRLGAVGFCWGGGAVNLLATRVPELAAGVPFYGPAPALDKVPAIRAELLLVFAGNDGFVNPGWPAYEAALKAAGVRYRADLYEGTQHGFHNDSTPRFDAAAAQLAWTRTLDLFNRTLRA